MEFVITWFWPAIILWAIVSSTITVIRQDGEASTIFIGVPLIVFFSLGLGSGVAGGLHYLGLVEWPGFKGAAMIGAMLDSLAMWVKDTRRDE